MRHSPLPPTPTGQRRGQDQDQDHDDDWAPIAALPGFWKAERVRMKVPLRSVALRLADDSLGICSPLSGLGAAAHAALARLGIPTLLIAPNHFHNLGLTEYASAHGGARIVAAQTALPRLARKCGGRELCDEGLLRRSLPPGVGLLIPPTTRNGELWLSAPAVGGRAWIVGDAFFNIGSTRRSPLGLLLWLVGNTPGLRIGGSFRWMIRQRAVYRQWLLDMIRAERPTMLVPCHGAIVVDPELPGRLERLAVSRV